MKCDFCKTETKVLNEVVAALPALDERAACPKCAGELALLQGAAFSLGTSKLLRPSLSGP